MCDFEVAVLFKLKYVNRGTVSERQSKNNFNYKPRPLPFLTLKLVDFDRIDGLTTDPKDATKLNTTGTSVEWNKMGGVIFETEQSPFFR